ncbi:MAG: succinate dehydrogenase iron-sulfur subunit, partial [Promicromonosporaceae bacterium]|nr:succinate dehydrogenase iron-sulfur subunit [Promicromonosporaceae bacterium]
MAIKWRPLNASNSPNPVTTPVVVKIRRYQPEKVGAKRAYWQDFHLTLRPTDRILDALIRIKDEYDGSLTFRYSCGHGICGSDALRINGRNRLACQTLIRELPTGKPITIEPIKGLPVLKDLVVDQEPFFAAYREVLPYLVPTPGDTPSRERLQTSTQVARYAESTKCILCAACTTSCPVFWVDGKYLGPAAIVAAHRFIFDSRDSAGYERLAILNGKQGVWRCRTVYNCTEACPRDIPVTATIAEVKR